MTFIEAKMCNRRHQGTGASERGPARSSPRRSGHARGPADTEARALYLNTLFFINEIFATCKLLKVPHSTLPALLLRPWLRPSNLHGCGAIFRAGIWRRRVTGAFQSNGTIIQTGGENQSTVRQSDGRGLKTHFLTQAVANLLQEGEILMSP